MAGSAPAFAGMTGLDGRGRGCRPITWDEAAHAVGRLVECAVDDEPPPGAKVFCFPGRGAFFSKKKRFLALATLFIAERVGGFAPVGHLYVFGLRFF